MIKRFITIVIFLFSLSFFSTLNNTPYANAADLCCPKGYDETSCPIFGADKPTQCCSHPALFIYNIVNKVSCDSSTAGSVCPGGSCSTALGNISTDPADFVKSIFGIILSIAGGVALVLIIISGYSLMFSQGNQEKVQAAREQLTSAIVGLLFIIFSITILQIVGVDILKLPGISR